jgi:DNA polymerase-1
LSARRLLSQIVPDRPEQLFLIDGNSLAYRAFFALPESIATSTGQPTNAIFGFASMLVKILTEYGPQATVVVWDAGSSGRKEVYAEYKGHRPSRPDLLAEQWPHLEPLVEAFGYTNLKVDSYEADDVIATLTERAKAEGVPVTVVTGDRDMFQLVDDGLVRIMATSRGITDTKLYDRQGVEDRYGIAPELIPDFYGLKGDTSDNIPGVPGIGDKTAAQLLQRFGTLEGVLHHVDEVSGKKRQENLRTHAENARTSKLLATAKRDVPVELDLPAVVSRAPDRSELREAFRRFELREPLRRLEEALGSADAAAPAPAADRSLSPALAAGRLAELQMGESALAISARAPEIPEDQLFGDPEPWHWGAWDGAGAAVHGRCADPAELARATGERPVIAHEAKALGAVPAGLVHDTEVAAYLLEPARRAYPFRELCEERGIGAEVSEPAAADAVLAHALAAEQGTQLEERGLVGLFAEVELPLVRVLREMELAGCRLDTVRLREITGGVSAEAAALEREIWEIAGEEFVIGSPKQLEEILFGKLSLSRKRRGKTGFSTDARVLQAIRDEHPIIIKVERFRELTKLVQTYLEALPDLIAADGRIHTTFNQTATATGRLSSTNPNLQNIPIRTELGRTIRACFVAEPGHVLVSADYEQVELRILAHIAQEDVLSEIFARGEDVHTATAATVFGMDPTEIDLGMRSKAKMVNYGIVYGLSAYGLADRLHIDQDEAQEFIDRYLSRFPAVAAFIARTIEEGTEKGYVSTLFGRRRQVPELRARRWEMRKQGERFAVNMVIQGTAADVMKIAMVRCHDALRREGLATRQILQIHDELLFEGPAAEEEAVVALAGREMAAAWEREPPLPVGVGSGPNWLAAK